MLMKMEVVFLGGGYCCGGDVVVIVYEYVHNLCV